HVAEQTLAAFVRTPHRPLVGRVLLNRKESRPTAPAQPFFRILLVRATVKIGLTNLAYKFRRLSGLEG
ncbi:hypothetical protein ACW7BJ_34725, partial [Azospirillum argentinense]